MPNQTTGPTPEAWQQVYGELRAIAERLLRSERRDHTLQPTALVNETWLRFRRDRRLHGLDSAETLSCAARTMRDVLVEHARRRNALKRGGSTRRVALDVALDEQSRGDAGPEERSMDLEALDAALSKLEGVDPQLARVVELRFFGGLSEEMAADTLGVSPRTVRRAWAVARQWLAVEIGRES